MNNSDSPYTLVLQGGGFRTAFTAGVLDTFIANDFDPFHRFVGVSGGAIVLSYFLGKQYGSAFEAMCLLATDDHFMKFTRTMSKEGYMDIDYLRSVANEQVPFALESAIDNLGSRPCHFVATDRRNGRPAYLQPKPNDWVEDVIASSTLPFFTKGAHELYEQTFFDGGWSDPLPARWAYGQGASRILLVQTAPVDMRLKQTWADYFGSLYFRGETELSRCFSESHLRYNESLDFILSPPDDLTLDHVGPIKPLRSGTFSHTLETLTADYRLGLDFGLQFLMSYKKRKG